MRRKLGGDVLFFVQRRMSGLPTRLRLIALYGEKGFDYAGNDASDLAVFAPARRAILVNMGAKIAAQAQALGNVSRCFEGASPHIRDWFRLMRLHQWKKNILLLAAPLADHSVTHIGNWLSLILAFLSFSLAASFVYIVNDLLDLENDRHHVSKKHRPLACGHIALVKAMALAPVMLFASLVLGFFAGGVAFLSWLVIYLCLTMAYSLGLKKIMLLDCVILAILYALRVIAGAAVLSIDIFSSWLMAFSLFLFLSLAFIKRYSELELGTSATKGTLKGRGYHQNDSPLIQAMGVASGFLSVLVLALYLNSPDVQILYKMPQLLWLDLPVLLYWIGYMWMQAHRGLMHEDPVVFATRDRVSLICGGIFLVILAWGAIGL